METPPPQQPQDPIPPQQPAPAPAPQPQAAYPHSPMAPSIRFDVIGQAFNMVFSDIGTWVVAALCLFVAVGVIYGVCFALMLVTAAAGAGILAILIYLVTLVAVITVANVMMANMYRMAIIALSGSKPNINEMFKFGPKTGNIVVCSILVGIFTGIGALACGIGAIVVGGLLMFAIPCVVDRDLAAMDAINLSWNTLKKDIVMAAVFFFVIGLCAEIGAVAIGIGVLFTFPVLPIAIAMLYRDYLGFASTPS